MYPFAQFPRCNGLVLAAAFCMGTAGPAAAQIIRGSVTDPAGAPAVGAVVTLVRPAVDDTVAGTDVRSVLVDGTGAFSVAAPQPGRYRIIVRRIGWRPYRSDVLTLAPGETERVDVRLEPLTQSSVVAALPEIRVTRASPCHTDQVDAPRIASLWNDARTALLATQASRADTSVPTLLIRYTRALDPMNLAVQTEELQLFDHHDVGNAHGFRSLSGDSLSVIGYWHRARSSTTTFHGPDASALLSGAFVRDHCFEMADSVWESPPAVGLRFEPVPARLRNNSPPEIRGAAWFDASTSRLLRVEFSWTRLPPGRDPGTALGGELTFSYGASGEVHVDRWYLRMPQEYIELMATLRSERRVSKQRIIEEGGIVFADSNASSAGAAWVYGDLRVGGRRPLAGAQVRVLGTELTATTDAEGRFSFRAVPAGLRVIVADHPNTSAFGMRTAVMRLLLDAGENRNISLIAPDQDGIAKSLCGEEPTTARRALLRVTVVDSATTQPIADYPVRLLSRESREPLQLERTTDASGAALFCALPPNRALVVSSAGGGILLSEFTLGRGELASRQLWIQR